MGELFSAAGFILRLLSIRDKEGIHYWNKFEEEIGMRGAVSRWKTGKDKPTPDSLLKIKNRFKVSIDWLLTGEEANATVAEAAPDYEARPLGQVEADLLNEVIAKIEEVLHEKPHPLTPEEKSRVISRIYNDCAEDRIKPDAVMVKRYLWLLERR
jgi:transcriptional regulator with XRE-family HTH domain